MQLSIINAYGISLSDMIDTMIQKSRILIEEC